MNLLKIIKDVRPFEYLNEIMLHIVYCVSSISYQPKVFRLIYKKVD